MSVLVTKWHQLTKAREEYNANPDSKRLRNAMLNAEKEVWIEANKIKQIYALWNEYYSKTQNDKFKPYSGAPSKTFDKDAFRAAMGEFRKHSLNSLEAERGVLSDTYQTAMSNLDMALSYKTQLKDLDVEIKVKTNETELVADANIIINAANNSQLVGTIDVGLDARTSDLTDDINGNFNQIYDPLRLKKIPIQVELGDNINLTDDVNRLTDRIEAQTLKNQKSLFSMNEDELKTLPKSEAVLRANEEILFVKKQMLLADIKEQSNLQKKLDKLEKEGKAKAATYC